MGEDKDVASIAFVQLYGLVQRDETDAPPVICRAFSIADTEADVDLAWVRDQVARAHGVDPLMYADNVKHLCATDDAPNIRSVEHLVFWFTSEGGPTWGQVIRI